MTTRHYGPHRDDEPRTVVVLGPGKWPQPELRALPPALVRQRRQLNGRAFDRGAR